eukprot:CAMPEP_0172533170 /NCGR_PEP_ID=MMETSP1067-20121228/5965_1 /TAXON_ID=265564 ORGANISM="Thalassiosira punctigera, Strain Tpunct2005C2" /NCGR_SAMPLE_ID=MMETSP1067 /ASSEMBLY_ACC=CAM_ASM_000444 /LENGTH=219 /DNA_ID=CAMNT_0013317775 /DNA_START=98 /DNA_END=758 /DNA_ORIENTATION=+
MRPIQYYNDGNISPMCDEFQPSFSSLFDVGMAAHIVTTPLDPSAARLIPALPHLQPKAVILGGAAHDTGVGALVPPAKGPVTVVVAILSAKVPASPGTVRAADAAAHIPIPLALGLEDTVVVFQAAARTAAPADPDAPSSAIPHAPVAVLAGAHSQAVALAVLACPAPLSAKAGTPSAEEYNASSSESPNKSSEEEIIASGTFSEEEYGAKSSELSARA